MCVNVLISQKTPNCFFEISRIDSSKYVTARRRFSGGICDSLEALGVSRYQVRFSSRRVLNLLLTYASITPARAVDVFRVIDKLEKNGIAKVRLEMTTGLHGVGPVESIILCSKQCPAIVMSARTGTSVESQSWTS